MTGKKPVIGALLVIALAYVVYPYATLYRLGLAIRHGDAATLENMVDWYAVREGIKEDICDNVFDQPTARVASGEGRLPPFGFSFVQGIAGNAVDENVNPQALVSAAHGAAAEGQPAQLPPDANPSIAWAFFDGRTSFSVLLRRPGAAAGEQPIRIEFQLRHAAWKVTRAWLPREMLMQANAKT
jgi:hypothetical protein